MFGVHLLSSRRSNTPASLGPSEEGWVIGPEGRLLLWIPTSLYSVMHVPGNKLVISNDASELDFHMASHGRCVGSVMLCRRLLHNNKKFSFVTSRSYPRKYSSMYTF